MAVWRCHQGYFNWLGYAADEIKDFYLNNPHVKEIIVLLGGKPIYVRYGQVVDRKFTKKFMDKWAR